MAACIDMQAEKTNGYACIDNDCASCLYEAGKLSLDDVLHAVIENELTETERNSVRLYWYCNMKINRIAAEFGVSESSIRRSLDRAYKKIETILKYIVLYNEMLDGKKKLPVEFRISLIRCKDGKEMLK